MRKLIVFVVFMIVTVNCFSQTSFGLKASYLIPSFNWNYAPKDFDESTAGISLGIVVEQTVKDQFCLQGELTYTVYNLDITDDDWYHLNYLELPIIVKYYFYKGLNIYGGIKVGFELDAGSGMEREINKDDISSINAMFPIGIGYKHKSGLYTDVRYNIGLSNVNKSDLTQFFDNFNAFEIGLGYFF